MTMKAGGKRQQVPGVRQSLLTLVLCCVLPLALMAALLIVNFHQYERTRFTDAARNRAYALISAVDRDFDHTQAALQALATSRLLQADDLRGFHAQALDALKNLQADSIVIVGGNGKLLLSTRRLYGTELPQLASAPLLQRIRKTGKPGVSDLFLGPVDGKLIYTIGVPIQQNGATVMTLNATISSFHLGQLLAGQRLSSNWRAMIVDSSGQIVARSHDIDTYLGKKIRPDLQRRLTQSNESSFEAQTLDGIPVFTVYSRSQATQWTVILGIPLKELAAAQCQTLGWLSMATLAALLAGLALAWRIGGGIARSIHALTDAASAVGSDRTLAVPELHFREAIELGQALQQGADRIRLAQARLHEGEQRLALAAAAADLGIWIRDLVQHEIWGSAQWRSLLGFSATETITLAGLLARVHPDDRIAVQHTLDDTLHGTGRYDMEYRIGLPGGALRWIGSHGRVEVGANGQPLLVRGVSLDITQRKEAELAVQQKQKEVMHLARVAMLGELSGALAHELNQPLTAILSNAQAAQRFMGQPQIDLDEVREILQDIVDEDKRAGAIIQRLRRLFDKNDARHQAVDINPLVLDVVHILRNDLINHGVTLNTELSPGPAMVSADSVQLQQVLINLLLNACDAMAESPQQHSVIVLRTAIALDCAGQPRVRISVIDHGCGIPATTLAHIFDPFFTTKERGMGLGLSICRTIITSHQGELWAENNPQGGASFHVSLPCIALEAA